ncbi:FAD-dependent oxidoreductase [Cohnella xylanilytica]|uniref:FAD-dependent oxidoreductase n=1 Tax=Cohnella xylanilytica TaxID=557555 RepID=A0A841UBS6_9BACL|nr:FAD-dependent oxidoreductase [Cohnella xylanilytica]MBB6695663.1 FAD-dependent oxidoreductase [Cohnella xylanilytica]
MGLPTYPESYWLATASMPSYGKLEEDLSTEVAVIGGGIAGITTACLLAREGKRVVLATADKLLNGTTGYTTAKLTAQHDLIYDEYIGHFGEEKARLYYEANMEGLEFVRRLVSEAGIDCDFAEEDAWIYTNSGSKLEAVEKEYEAYKRLGIPGSLEKSIPLTVPARLAVVMRGQARFHPVPYLRHLTEEFVRLGGRIFEDTTIDKVEENGDTVTVTSADGRTITCGDAVSCSHFPIPDSGFYFARLHCESSYAIAVRAPGELPRGMYISAEKPNRSVRTITYGGEKLLLLGGESHKVGQKEPGFVHYEALEDFAKKEFGATDIVYRWSAQDFEATDKLPYIGHVSEGKKHIYVATGFRKWGMTTSVVAARLLTDLILGRDNRYAELYSPSRFHADPDVGTLAKENLNVAGQLISGKLEWVRRKPEDLGPDEGGHVRVNGRKAGAYRSPEGELFVVDTTCRHMGCEVAWNDGDRTWDCPCHGSRYTFRGEVIEGPAKKDLERLS